MRLQFRVLWFENQPQDVRTQIEEIEEYVREVGFIPQIEMQVDASNLNEYARQQQLYNEVDLVVVDFDLGNPDENGDHVAQMVRRGFGFTDIIFYSGHKTVDLRNLVKERGIDGVYCMERPQLFERLALHIDQVVRRLSRLEAMRGLAMGTVGKIDDELRLLIAAEYGACTAAQQSQIVATLDDLVASGARVQAEGYAKCEDLAARLESRAVTSFHLQKLALAITKGNQACGDERKLLGKYDNEVLQPRNTLGHAIETKGDKGWEVTSAGKPPITSVDFRKLRQDLARHLANILSLRPILQGQRGKETA
ncbi:MAG: hypothetical protein GC201_04725 [Alphaproteobacteria bacterium]|nr:hypothetical protein [Alphaproteobacteria bacterium]